MILKQDLKWSPDGMRVEIIRAGVSMKIKNYPNGYAKVPLQLGLSTDKRTPVAQEADKSKKQHS
ncbi:hypothetical protein O5282_05705 [Escherichia coli]|nr:hypothetical protein [Escherichia coli]